MWTARANGTDDAVGLELTENGQCYTQAETWQIVRDMGNNLSERVSEIAQQWYSYSAVDPNVNTGGQLNFGGTQPVDL